MQARSNGAVLALVHLVWLVATPDDRANHDTGSFQEPALRLTDLG